MRKPVLLALAVALLFGFLPETGQASATDGLRVTIPSYPVTVNGITLDNLHSKYPLLNYNGITYFPMTWDYSTSLGLSAVWTAEDGLTVWKQGAYAGKPAQELGGAFQSGQSFQAGLPEFPIRVNGNTIDNASEPYPLLEFRDITYFPMTWRFAVEEFHWKTGWDSTEGFSIVTEQRKWFDTVRYDDADYLYAKSLFGDGYYRIPKALNETPALISVTESKKVDQHVIEAERRYAVDRGAYTGERTVKDGEWVKWQGITLLSLKPIIEENDDFYANDGTYENKGIRYTDSIIPLHDSKYLINITAYKLTHIPAPYTPHRNYSVLVDLKKKESYEIKRFSQPVDYYSVNPDGSCWIWSWAPQGMEIRARNADRTAQLALVKPDGSSVLINEQLDVQDIDVIRNEQGKLVIKAYNNRLNPDARGEKDGMYRLDPNGGMEQISGETGGYAYMDSGGRLFLVSMTGNEVTDLTNQKTKLWWDYELEQGQP